MTFIRPWTPAEDDMLARLVESGASARQIGATMGKTRNAIIGRCGRAGIKLKQPANVKGERAPKRQRVPGVPKSKPRSPASVPRLAFVTGPAVDPTTPVAPRMVSLMDLQAQDCRWPSEGEGEHTKFCGHPRDGASSYCAHHRMRAYTTPEQRRAAA